MGLNFYYNDGLQPKMRAGIINEHECNKGCEEKKSKCVENGHGKLEITRKIKKRYFYLF